MPYLEYRILRYLHREASPVLWSKLLNDCYILANPAETDAVLKSMLSSGLILTTSPASDPQLSSVSLSGSALLTLLREEERREKESQASKKAANEKAKKERQQRFENKIAIANLLIPVVTFILGILVEHFTGIVRTVINLFS